MSNDEVERITKSRIEPRQVGEGIFAITQTGPNSPGVTAWVCGGRFLDVAPGTKNRDEAWVYMQSLPEGPPGFTPLDPAPGSLSELAFSSVSATADDIAHFASDPPAFADWIRMNAGGYGWPVLTAVTLLCDGHIVSRRESLPSDTPNPPSAGEPTAGTFAIKEGPDWDNNVAYVCRSAFSDGPGQTQQRFDAWVYRREAGSGIQSYRQIGDPGSGDLAVAGQGNTMMSGYAQDAAAFAYWIRQQGMTWGPSLDSATFDVDNHVVQRQTQEPPHDR